MLGGYAGGQAEYARVPFADVGPHQGPRRPHRRAGAVPLGHLPHRLHGRGDVRHQARRHGRRLGLRARSGSSRSRARLLLGAERVIAIDRFPYRLRMAREQARRRDASTTKRSTCSDALKEMTGGRGPDACIDAVGLEAHGARRRRYAYDRAKQALMLETDRPIALREAIMACRNGGTVSVIGVYGGFVDKFPMGAVDEPLAHHQERPVPRAALHAAAARAHRERRDRPELRHHPPAAARGRAARATRCS